MILNFRLGIQGIDLEGTGETSTKSNCCKKKISRIKVAFEVQELRKKKSTFLTDSGKIKMTKPVTTLPLCLADFLSKIDSKSS